jgi:hypothetical protein
MSAMKEAYETAIERLAIDQEGDTELVWQLASEGIITPIDIEGLLWERDGIVYNSTDKGLLS